MAERSRQRSTQRFTSGATVADEHPVDWLPSLVTVAVTAVVILAVRLLEGRIWAADPNEERFRKQIYTIAVLFAGMLVTIFLLPEGSNQDLAFGVIGLVVTGALAISSQSIIANGMAGLLLRSLGKFRPGDFIEVDSSLGRVTELGLFHTEIQTADRDLTTIPNSLMVTNPVKVVRSSGTIVSANVSLGYDVSRHDLKPLFLAAAETAGLREPFVQVVDLGDYSVVYRIAGFLDEPNRLLQARSALRGAVLDRLHDAGVEIMSPMFVATRSADRTAAIPPAHDAEGRAEPADDGGARLVFDKAELAAAIETHRSAMQATRSEIDELKEQLGTSGVEHPNVASRIAARERRLERLTSEIHHLEALLGDE